MKKIEATGRTTEEALWAAAQQLGVAVDALDYEIVEEASKGFMGLGQTPTLIKAWVAEGQEPRARQRPPVDEPAETIEEEKEADIVDTVSEPLEEPKADFEQAMEGDGDAQQLGQDLAALLDEVLAAMHLDAKSEVKSIDGQEVLIELAGADVGILTGRQAQTLDALQYLMGIVASRISAAKRRVILDAEGYREHQREILRQKALEYAKAVVEAGQEAVLEPQPARDRRIVHLALAEHPEVYTYSEGEGDQRHVVISPKK